MNTDVCITEQDSDGPWYSQRVDPNAADSCRQMGAIDDGVVPSGTIPGLSHP